MGNPDRNIGRGSFGLSLALAALSLLCLVSFMLGNACFAETEQTAIKVGSEFDFHPYAFVDEQGQAAGFSVDLVKAVVGAMGLSVNITAGPWDTEWNALVSGKLDVLPIVAKLPQRVGLIDFSLPHTETYDAFFVRKGNSPIPDIATAQGKSIVTMRSDASHHELLARHFKGNVVLVDSIPEGLSLVASGSHDAFLGPLLIASLAIKNKNIRGLVQGPPIPDYKRVFSFGVRKGADELREKLNQGLLIVKTNGEYERIYHKWLAIDAPESRYKRYLLASITIMLGLILVASIVLWGRRKIAQRRIEAMKAHTSRLEHEIRERKLAEQALRESEQSYRRQFEDNSAVMLLIDTKDGRIIDANTAAQEFYGYSRDRLQQMYISEINTLSTLDVKKHMETVTTEHGHRFEFQHRLADGSIRDVDVSVSQIQFGESRLLSSIIHDITKRKEVEDALLESEKRYRSLFDQSLDAIAIQEGSPPQFTLVNPAYCALFGYAPEEIYAMAASDIWGLVHPDDRELVKKSLQDRLDGCIDSVRYSFRILRKDGAVRWVDVSGRRLEPKGRPMNLSIYRDVTIEKQTNELLNKAKQRADSANMAKSEFLASMSHEIRTPLNGVLGMLQLLKTTHLDDEQSEYVQMATKSSKRLTRLLTDILDLSKVESGKLVLQEDQFSLSEVRAATMDIFGYLGRQKGLEVGFTLDSCLPARVIGDDARLRQILLNLMGNAVKYTDQGFVRGEVTLASAANVSPLSIVFTVTDSGCGIPEEHLANIFEPFEQVRGSIKHRSGGVGLGLAIVKRLVDLMGGEIAVQSAVGQGTVMRVTLPFKLPINAQSQALQQAPTFKLAQSLRILLVEDEETSQAVIQKYILKAKHEVVVAADGQEALQRFAEQNFDLILMDIQMPVMDGVEATKRIRNGEAGADKSNTPIIAMTAYAMVGDKEKFIAAGIDDYIAKPVEMDALNEVLVSVMSRKAT